MRFAFDVYTTSNFNSETVQFLSLKKRINELFEINRHACFPDVKRFSGIDDFFSTFLRRTTVLIIICVLGVKKLREFNRYVSGEISQPIYMSATVERLLNNFFFFFIHIFNWFSRENSLKIKPYTDRLIYINFFSSIFISYINQLLFRVQCTSKYTSYSPVSDVYINVI